MLFITWQLVRYTAVIGRNTDLILIEVLAEAGEMLKDSKMNDKANAMIILKLNANSSAN